MAAAGLLLAACTPGEDDPAPAPEAPADEPDGVDDPDGPDEPDDPAEESPLGEITDDEAGAADRDPPPADEVEAALPEGWAATVVEDDRTGPYLVGAPEDAVVWAVGEDLDPLFVLAEGTDWWAFWQPRLVPLEPDIANVRAMVVAPGDAVGIDPDEVLSIQVNLTPFDLDVEPDDAAAIAEIYAAIFESQGSEVTDARVVDHGGPEVDEVAEVAHTLDPQLLDRDVRQRFVPIPEIGALWSVQCDGPSGADLAEACDAALDAFRPPLT